MAVLYFFKSHSYVYYMKNVSKMRKFWALIIDFDVRFALFKIKIQLKIIYRIIPSLQIMHFPFFTLNNICNKF